MDYTPGVSSAEKDPEIKAPGLFIMLRPVGLCVLSALFPVGALAQVPSDAELQKRANGVLTLMGFSLTPDVTTGSLSISDQSAGNPYFRQTSISGGGRPKKDVPLYLEGTLAYGRYDPTFVVGDSQTTVSVKWNSLLGTGG